MSPNSRDAHTNHTPDSKDTVDRAMARLRAADPAAQVPPLRLGVEDMVNRAEDETLVDRTPGRNRSRLLVPLVAAVAALLVLGGVLISNPLGKRDVPFAGTPVGPLQVRANCDVDAEPADAPPAEAVSVSLCDDTFDQGLFPPPDALVENIDQLIAAFDQLEPTSGDMMCTEEMGPAYTLVFTAADGTTTMVSGQLYGCRTIGERLGADRYLGVFTELLLEQRANHGPWTDELPAATCNGGSWIVATPDAADRDALLCIPNDDGTFRAVEVAGEDLRTLRADLLDHAAPRQVDSDGQCFDRVTLILTTSYGDQLAVDIGCGVGDWQTSVRGSEAMEWKLSPESVEIIDRLTR